MEALRELVEVGVGAPQAEEQPGAVDALVERLKEKQSDRIVAELVIPARSGD